jgi:hypothetical protein
MTTQLRITALTAASVDIGDGGHPGSGASQITCEIIARRDGKWEAHGYHSVGCNQGYYQENYGHGPWAGRGETPEAACRDMVERADDEYQADMRRAAHDAMLEIEGATFASLASDEADRIAGIVANDGGTGFPKVKIGRIMFSAASGDEAASMRKRAVKMLRRLAGPANDSLSRVSDDQLLAEAKRRGLISE